MLGLIGVTLITLSRIGVRFDVWDVGGTVQALATIPNSSGSCHPAFTTPWRSSSSRTLRSFRRPRVDACVQDA
jgi:hypothetical protein